MHISAHTAGPHFANTAHVMALLVLGGLLAGSLDKQSSLVNALGCLLQEALVCCPASLVCSNLFWKSLLLLQVLEHLHDTFCGYPKGKCRTCLKCNAA